MSNYFPSCPTEMTNTDSQGAIATWIRQIAQVAARVNQGKMNAVMSVTLTPSATTTVVKDSRISVFSYIEFDPTTANALAAKPTTYVAQVDRTKGQFTITHANNSQTDRIFNVLIIG